MRLGAPILRGAGMVWLEPWVAIVDLEWDAEKKRDYCAGWENQLTKEVGERHALFGKSASLVARRFDTDDALFRLSSGEVAEVHLTWSRGMEPDPRWPNATIFSSLEAWARKSMAVQHQEWCTEQ
jgi:hypothetical protein